MRIEQSTRKAVAEIMRSPEYLSELDDRILQEQRYSKDFFGGQTNGLKELILEFVNDTQVMWLPFCCALLIFRIMM